MSLSWRNRVQVLVGHERVALGRVRRGYGTALKAWHVEPCKVTDQARPWVAAVSALEPALRAFECRGAEATVILSNAFVRYQVVPWNEHVNGRAERDAYVRQCFQRVFGDDVRAWSLKLSEDRYGAPALASAVDEDLPATIRGALQRNGIRIASIQPYLMWAFNRWRALLDAGNCCLALVERGHVCLALCVGGAWHAVKTVPAERRDPEVVVGELVERELCLSGLEPAGFKVYVRAPEHTGFKVRSASLTRITVLGGNGRSGDARGGDALFGFAGTH